jgi:hypothetical protein
MNPAQRRHANDRVSHNNDTQERWKGRRTRREARGQFAKEDKQQAVKDLHQRARQPAAAIQTEQR